MTKNAKRGETILLAAIKLAENHPMIRSQLECIWYSEKYAEPGYGSPENGIYFGDWNPESFDIEDKRDPRNLPARVFDLLERAGYEAEWCDEWDYCSDCNRAFRKSPDSYGWAPSYAHVQGNDLCCSCILYAPEEYLTEISGDHSRMLTMDIPLADHGYVRLPLDFERGLHHGQASDPAKIAEGLKSLGIEDFIFKLDCVQQFDATFSVYVECIEQDGLARRPDELAARLQSLGTDSEESPAVLTERALRNSPPDPSPEKPGFVHTTINVDTGEAVTRKVTLEEFIRGKAGE